MPSIVVSHTVKTPTKAVGWAYVQQEPGFCCGYSYFSSENLHIEIFVAVCYIVIPMNIAGVAQAMPGPYRLSNDIVAHAEASADIQNRTVPKQIEHWANLGRRVERMIDHPSLMAILQDLAIVEVKLAPSKPVEAQDIFAKLEADRRSGKLTKEVTRASVIYEASPSRPGLLDRIDERGVRATGHFENGEFVLDEQNQNADLN